MSGTSLDGIDIALVDIDAQGHFQFIDAETIAYDELLLDTLQHAITEEQLSFKLLGELDIKLGIFIAEHINAFLQKRELSPSQIKAIGNHGQTLYHSPLGDYTFSQQIGNNHHIAELTGITTIGDIRQRDMAAGGQGAPLVPAFHQQQFASVKEDRVIVNIGGIANITFLSTDQLTDVIGFDTGPGNGLLNAWIKHHLNKDYDSNGEWAASGFCHQGLLDIMMADPYFQRPIPKSTGREYFNLTWLNQQLSTLSQPIPNQDIQATLLELTAQSISQHIERYCPQADSVFICGGGAHNRLLVQRLANLNAERHVNTTDELGLNPDWVEACAFAWIANRTLNGLAANLPSVTGAQKNVILGAIYSSNDAS